MLTRRALFLLLASAALAQQPEVALAGLAEGRVVAGFRTAALYLNDADEPMGARFIHGPSGFTLDYLRIQSVPQAYIWVNTFPTSNMGEPHTQEHLLLGKGNKGRAVANLQSMTLSSSSAYTMQWRTCYFFNTLAGPEAFYREFDRRMDALLHPDYTDEEVRREVRNFGVSEDRRDKSLRLEEKGTVYAEMVTTLDQPAWRMYRALDIALYGPEHPLSYVSGGTPEALRLLQPADIQRFHQDNYQLGNMGMVASFPREMPLGGVLARLDSILRALDPKPAPRTFQSESTLPKPQPAPPGQIQIVDYPNKDEQQSGSIAFAWPATLELQDLTELSLLRLFLQNMAGAPDTNFYRMFVDSRTRQMDLGAKSVSASVSDDLGHPVMVAFGDVPRDRINEREIAAVRRKLTGEFQAIAGWKDGSRELSEFNARLRGRLVASRRDSSKFVNSPPGFGFRMTSAAWMRRLHELSQSPGFRKSVTMKPESAAIEALLARPENIWRQYLAKWKLAEAEPYAAASRANPALIRQAEKERAARIQDEIERLKAGYGVQDGQEALRRYRSAYNAATARLEQAAGAVKPPRFVENPPLSLDDPLDYEAATLPGGVPLVASAFDGMTSATAGIALRLEGVPERRLVYLAALPALLTRVGVILDGKPVSYDEMQNRLRNEILSLNAAFSVNHRSGRAEIVVRGAGNDPAEARKALDWIKAVLFHPDWRPENLARIRDQVDQLTSMRLTMQRSEESWARTPAAAYQYQSNPLLFSLSSFLTQTHDVYRLRWMLKDAREHRDAIAGFLDYLAGVPATRAGLQPLIANPSTFERLPEAARPLARELAKDLDQILPEIPDSSLAADWPSLCREMRRDVLVPPETALAELDALRRSLLKTGNARLFLISSRETRKTLDPGIRDLAAALEKAPAARAAYSARRIVEERLRAREPGAARPLFVALVNPNTQGGIFTNSAPAAWYGDTDREKLLDYLASNLYAGPGGHSMFMKTWSAGLAYSNGLNGSPASGRLGYYAERTPELPQTLQFVIQQLNQAPPDPSLADYAVAQAFRDIRAASPYEIRGEAMAADLADGVTPEVVVRFHKAVLELGRSPGFADRLFQRMKRVYGRVVPGLGVKAAAVPGGVYFVIGPEKQLAAYEQFLKTAEGPEARLFRLYPRDFWMQAR